MGPQSVANLQPPLTRASDRRTHRRATTSSHSTTPRPSNSLIPTVPTRETQTSTGGDMAHTRVHA